jgi:tetratricopeptide (TPR) repeat protein
MQTVQRVCRVFLALILFAMFARSQSSPLSTVSAQHQSGDFASEPFVVEQLRNVVRFESDGKGQKETTIRIRVQSESAVREFGLLVYPFTNNFESLDVVYVRVRKPDGTVIDTPSDAVQELDSAVSREAPMYTDQREKHIAVKSLGVGDILEVSMRWTIREAVAPGHFWYDHNFFEQGICLDDFLVIDIPAEVSVKIKASNPQPEIKVNGTRRIYTFHSSHLQKAEQKDQDQVIPAWEKDFYGVALPAVRMTSFASWAEVGVWYSGLQQARVQVTPRIRATAEEITKGKSTDDEKIRAIYDFVASRFRYIGIDLGSSRYTPHAAEEVLGNRYGDCKDKHTLFAALLEAEGLHAYPALISSKYKDDPELPSPSLFDHVISAIPTGDSYLFLDTTPEVAPYGLLLAQIRDRRALVMPSSGPAKLVITPTNPAIPNTERFRMEASIDSQGTLDGKARFEDRGDSEIGLRIAYRNTPQNQWKELTQAISGRMGFAGTVSEVIVSQPEKTAEPFWLSYDYHRTDYSDWKENRITLPFPPMFLPDLNEAQKKSNEPLPVGTPLELLYEASINLPHGIQSIQPPNVERKTDFADYSATYVNENGVLRGTRHLTLKMREIPGSQRGDYSAFVKEVDDDAGRWIVLSGKNDSQSLMQKAYFLLREGKVPDAVSVLDNAAADDPSNKQLTLMLGEAYLREPDDAKAIAEFQKLLADKPDAFVLNTIAYDYADSGVHLREAVDYASRAVAELSAETTKVNLDSATLKDFMRMSFLAAHWDTLGWAKFRSGESESAEKYLYSAWALNPKSVVGEHLVEVYEKLGKKHEADHICRLALAASRMGEDPETKTKLLAAQKRIGLSKPETTSGGSIKPHFGDKAADELSEIRTVTLPRNFELKDKSKLGLFTLAWVNGQAGHQAHFVSGDKELMQELKSLETINILQSFPDHSPATILRAGWLSCSQYTSNCALVLFLVDDMNSMKMVASKND